MLSVGQIKTVLSLAGINNLSVKFEPESRQIRTGFDYFGKHQEEIISFEQVERLFTDSQEDVQQALPQELSTKR